MSELGMIVDGIASSEAIDTAGEQIELKGADISSYLDGSAVVNFEHRGPDSKGHTGMDIVGKVIFAKKIYKKVDCDDERQQMFWNKIELPFLYVKCRLFDAAGHENAKALAAMLRDSVANNEPSLLNFSCEGSTLEREGGKLTKVCLRALAVTVKPANKSAIAGVLKDPQAPEGFDKNPGKSPEKSSLEDLVDKNELRDPLYHRLGTSVEFTYVPIEKSLEAGSYDAAPSTLTGGAALQVEDPGLRRKKIEEFTKRAAAVFRDWDKLSDIKPILKHKLPEASEGFINHFVDMADDYRLGKIKKAQEQDDILLRKFEYLTVELATELRKGASVKPQQVPKEPAVLNSMVHGDWNLNRKTEQHALIHGTNLDEAPLDKPQSAKYAIGMHDDNSHWRKMGNGAKAYIKPAGAFKNEDPSKPENDPINEAHREVIYHNIAKDFFGMGDYLPNVAHFKHPRTGEDQAVIEHVPGRHIESDNKSGKVNPSKEQADTINKLGHAGELDKLTAMDHLLGNQDRHQQNYLTTKDGKGLKLIDHGLSFNYDGGIMRPAYMKAFDDINGLDKNTEVVHPEADKWIQSLNPDELQRHMLSHKLPQEYADHAKNRLVKIQQTLKNGPLTPRSVLYRL